MDDIRGRQVDVSKALDLWKVFAMDEKRVVVEKQVGDLYYSIIILTYVTNVTI
jgi:hypothetical protein